MGWVRDHAEKHLNKHLDHLRQAGQVRQENGGSQGAGASWSPNKPPYDVKLPIYPVSYSEEEKTAQREAGKKLAQDVKDAIGEKRDVLDIPRGVYRISDAERGTGEALMLIDSENFTFRGPGVEIICELGGSHARVLGNKNLTLEGSRDDPLIIESEPLGFTQGHIIESNKEELTIDFQIMEGYRVPIDGGRIELFSPEGVMFPHTQDGAQEVHDLGGGRFRLKMNGFTWGDTLPSDMDKFAPGNLIAMEQGGRGGFEMRHNHGVKFKDVIMCCAALVWAMPEEGDNVFENFKGCRRPGTNRLIGGGWPLQTFWHGSFTMIDSEVGHNYDDITDINTPPNYAFEQRSPREFFMFDVDGSPLEDGCELTLYKFPHMELVGKNRVVRHEEKVDEEVQRRWIDMCKKINIREGGAPRLYTVENDVEVGDLLMVDSNWKCTSMKFINSYLHDGLAGGAQPKGAHVILIENCIIERVNLAGIGVGFDPFWWEGNPSSNIRILNNTVNQCPCGPGVCYPAITVYAGGDDPGSTAPVMQNVEVIGNLVLGSLGPGIGVRQAGNVAITDNVIVHYPEQDAGYASIQVDAVTEGTEISNNTFVNLGRDAWQLPISVGPRTPPSAFRLSNNRTQDPDEQLPDTPWQFFFWGSAEGCKFEGDWCLEGEHLFPNDKAWTNKRENKVTFEFEGSEVAVKGMRCQNAGKCDVFVDDQHQGCIDMSRMYGQSCVIFRSQPLEHGRHSIRLEGAGEKGEFSNNDTAIILEGFYVLAYSSGHDGHCVV